MSRKKLTRHARARMQQRGVRGCDLDLILEHGTPTSEGAIVLRSDVEELEAAVRRLRDLVGRTVIAEGDWILSTYRTSRRKRRWLTRGSH